MDLIFQSNHAPMLKLSLLDAWKASMVEIGNDIAYRDADKTELGTSRGGNSWVGRCGSYEPWTTSAPCRVTGQGGRAVRRPNYYLRLPNSNR